MEVDRDQDEFDCPFCGSHYDAVAFHGKDLVEQAKELILKKDFKSAREKYEYLLSRKPGDTDFLYGYACAVGEVSSLDYFYDPKKSSPKLLNLLRNDPRYATGPAAPYYAKLAEMFAISNKSAELAARKRKLETDSKEGITKISREREFNGFGLAIYLIFHFIFGSIFVSLFYPVFGLWVFAAYFIIPGIVCPVVYKIYQIQDRKKEPEYAERLAPFYAMKKEANELKKEIDNLEDEYEKALKEIRGLKPELGAVSSPAVKPNVPQKNDINPDPEKTVVCKKCGADLVLDKEQKLYVCNHCGVSYDYSVFVGDPKSKAFTDFKNGEYELADKRFAQILEDDPSDFDANRGRILCAAGWYGFTQIRLGEDLENIDWALLEERLNTAIENSDPVNLAYFTELKELIDIAREYYVICDSMRVDDPKADLRALLQKKALLLDDYRAKYRSFLEKDRKHRAFYNENLANNPDSMFGYRMRILSAGHWETINSIDTDIPLIPGRIQLIRNVIEEALENSTDEYYEYFEMWNTFIELFREYVKSKAELDRLCKQEEELRPKAVNNGLTERWNRLVDTISEHKKGTEKSGKEYGKFYNKLIEFDKKLFYEDK